MMWNPSSPTASNHSLRTVGPKYGKLLEQNPYRHLQKSTAASCHERPESKRCTLYLDIDGQQGCAYRGRPADRRLAQTEGYVTESEDDDCHRCSGYQPDT